MGGRDESAAPLAPGVCASSALPLMGVERMGGGAAAAGAAAGGGAVNGTARASEPPRKRPKLAADDSSALRKRILEYKLLRLKSLRDRLTEQLSELYFLQAGGNMMDYAAWRKRPPAPPLAAFLEARRPPPPPPPPPEPPPPAPALPAAGVGGVEVVEKARQEAVVARRVAELARAGLWAERRLPRVLEPPRPKAHWDYLLEEMAWLAQDFAHERKWKKQAAKKCARAVQKYFQDKAAAAQKAEKAQELQLKRIAAFAAKEIRTFWTNVEKVVEWKRWRRVERARKEALDEQLSYIVDRTERYSRQLAANLHTDTGHTGHTADHPHSPPLSDYGPDADDSADDEDTIAEQERRERAEDTAAEIDALKQEAELTIDELVRKYASAPPSERSSTATTGSGSDSAGTETDTDADTDTDTEEGSAADSDSERPLEALVTDTDVDNDAGNDPALEGGEKRVEACASLAAALQPTGTTLAETAVGTAVPRLLRHSLREYQHVGLHWLATMHARRLNGILADEMGLGKTIQTIALLAHLALQGDWGPHLVVAPTSVVLNWECEFKKWCPAFKILTYYGTIKERKLKRVGWTKANSFHVCITSYKLVVQDHQSFRRKKWKYLILDEAHNIKNFKSQRWQMLLNFHTERRLLLTGTPLQNSLLELWSLMHFLMPAVFASHSHFREWFADVAACAEGAARNDALVRRLHEVLRPFLLRRLKADVERQMPRKYEHVVLCRLAKRQRCLYDDYMARAATRRTLAAGNLLSVINVLMQLRKVCNHPDLFEPRPVRAPLQLPALRLAWPAIALTQAVHARTRTAARLAGDLATLEAGGAEAFAAHRTRHLAPARRLVHELPATATATPPAPPPRPPPARLRLHLRLVPRVPPALPAPPPPPPAPPARAPPPAAPPAPAPAPSPGAARLSARREACLRRLAAVNERRCWSLPLYGADLRGSLHAGPPARPPKDLEELLDEMADIIDRFSVCWVPARAPAAELVVGGGGGAGGREWRRRAGAAERGVRGVLRAARALLHAPIARQAVAFPHPRLLQYDCGKLQTLSRLLRRLKAGGHRVLVFTQMTRVLDVLEAFLSMHGHTYLRLDGATRVEARQALVERFNSDARLFAMILSTRSGGVGLNLTGADCVVFYDSDWNPTMDAQAQDRAHRIGQTRDVHVFRLVTANTVEENILRKADQKRALGHLAIEDGHFTTSVLRQANIKELFGSENAPTEEEVAAEEEKPGEGEVAGAGAGGGELETALAAAEDEADAAAARAARAEQRTDLAEFDETLPLDDDQPDRPDGAERPDRARSPHHHDKAELAALMKQLTPIEKYAMRLVESSEAAGEAERAALSDMRRQLRDWEDKRRALREDAPPAPPSPAAQPPDLVYPRRDAAAQVWVSGFNDRMPLWCPPTPPQAESDVYCEQWARVLYRGGAAGEGALPPAPRRARSPRRRAPPRAPPAPPSLFERAGPRPRARPRPPPAAPRDAPPPPEWSAAEDAALRRALRLQRLPAAAGPPGEPSAPGAARAPNWEWASELVNEVARCYRSARAVRDRHDALQDPERARRKHKKAGGAARGAGRRAGGGAGGEDAPEPPLARLEVMRAAAERRRDQPKRRLDEAAARNPKHAALLAELGVDYDAPPTPMEVASRRADRIAKEKLKAGAAATATPASAAPAPTPAVSTASAPAPAPAPAAPQRVVVAAQPPARPAAALYRPQPLAARHHLKILHHAPHPQGAGGVDATAGGAAAAGAGAALRTLQLQQLALRRAPPTSTAPATTTAPPTTAAGAPAPAPAHSHVVVAHLAPAPATPAPAPSAPADPHRPDDRAHH